MSPLRLRMIEDMTLAGFASGTQDLYAKAVRKLAAHYRRSPDELTEEEVRAYLVGLRDQGVARGTFKTNYCGIQFFYRHTLDCDWALFSKKPSWMVSACGRRNAGGLSSCWKGAADSFLVASDPVKKHGPWVVARLRVVTPFGDPV